jgi:hypothetical protein
MYRITLGILLCSTAFVSPGYAGVTTLADLIAGGTITDGDKVFSDFGYSPTGAAPTAANIGVMAFTNGAGDFGIQFTGSFTGVGTTVGDAAITYMVTVTNPLNKIDDASAVSTGTAIGGAFWDVGETLTNGSTTVGTLTTFNVSGVGSQPSDSVSFAPVSYLLVAKDIGFGGNGGLADLSILDQNFSQISEIPEQAPWGMMLLGFGGLGALGIRRKERASRTFLAD